LISLQKGDPEKDILNLGAESFIFDPMPRCEDWEDTASVVAGLDLIISVDSAVAHIAGAMSKPCIMLSPFTRCWRWWNIPNGLPWYNNMTILKQEEKGSWETAMAEAIDLAAHMVKGQGH